MQLLLSILVISTIQQGLETRFVETKATLPTAGLFERVRTWTGEELDHLGIGISALGDVNGDGHPDFILGKMTGAYTFYFGPGAARVISGKDGSPLYEVQGTNKRGDCGDAFGDTIAALGDLDGDGAPDFAVGAWRYEEYVGYVAVYSGRDGSPLATIYGGKSVVTGKGPIPPETCGLFKGDGFGKSIVALGDLDGDSTPDFAVNSTASSGPTYLISGASFAILGSIGAIALGPTGDFDEDGRQDLACLSRHDSVFELSIVSSLTLESLKTMSLGRELEFRTLTGDVDGDGFADLFIANGASGNQFDGPTPLVGIPTRWVSGKSGEVLRMLSLNPGGYAREIYTSHIGDVDDDGRPDLLVQTFMHSLGSRRWILSGGTGSILGEDAQPSWTDGRRAARVGDVDGDGRVEFLVSDFESPEGTRCGGAVHLVRLRPFGK